MSKLTIKDLSDSIDLDRQAMLAIVGGARTRGYQPLSVKTAIQTHKIVDFPSGFVRHPLAARQSTLTK